MSSTRGAPTLMQRLAGGVAESFLLSRGRQRWEANAKCWSLRLNKIDKLLAGVYLILSDYAAGIFPPRFEDQASAYQAEIDYDKSLPGESSENVYRAHTTKPFWDSWSTRFYLEGYIKIIEALERHNVRPPQRLLELGCGSGWAAEFLATHGYSVVGTTIAPFDVEIADKKKQALAAKGIKAELEFLVAPMECVHKVPSLGDGFDAAFIFEALHHAFDWRQTLDSVARSLKPGGWFLIANEPNLLHTFISYRVAKLAKTHEIGMSKSALIEQLRKVGFSEIHVLQPRVNNFVTHIWLMARKG